jgi:hypothetical protein
MKRIGKLRDTDTPPCRCPWCGHRFDAAMSANPDRPDAAPKPGDVSVCISCAQVLVFTDDLTLRASMPGEIELTPALRRAQQAVRMLDRRTMR